MQELLRFIEPRMEMAAIVQQTILRLVLAAILGGIIGLEREVKRKPAGLRTNMFICFGSAMFTMLSDQLASAHPGDHTRIAAQIIPGIGFIGAGAILHSRGAVTGLTTAATLFVVASVGMAVGGGLYLPAVFATMVILLALYTLGRMEAQFSLKPLQVAYEVIGENADDVVGEVNHILEEEHQMMQSMHAGRVDHQYRVQFVVDATRTEHDTLLQRLRQSPLLKSANSLGPTEHE